MLSKIDVIGNENVGFELR